MWCIHSYSSIHIVLYTKYAHDGNYFFCHLIKFYKIIFFSSFSMSQSVYACMYTMCTCIENTLKVYKNGFLGFCFSPIKTIYAMIVYACARMFYIKFIRTYDACSDNGCCWTNEDRIMCGYGMIYIHIQHACVYIMYCVGGFINAIFSTVCCTGKKDF